MNSCVLLLAVHLLQYFGKTKFFKYFFSHLIAVKKVLTNFETLITLKNIYFYFHNPNFITTKCSLQLKIFQGSYKMQLYIINMKLK